MSLYRVEWVMEGKLAGMALPDGTPDDWDKLKARGIGAVVNLTQYGTYCSPPTDNGLAYLHLPIPDFHAPTPAQVERFIRFCDDYINVGRAVAVHCLAGRGRTGTMAACYMVHMGMGAEEAMAVVRRVRRGSIETDVQEDAVRRYARRCGRDNVGKAGGSGLQ